jgi:uncharacterized protein YigE (DUF2233 family)
MPHSTPQKHFRQERVTFHGALTMTPIFLRFNMGQYEYQYQAKENRSRIITYFNAMTTKMILFSALCFFSNILTAQQFYVYTADPAKDSMEMHYIDRGIKTRGITRLVGALTSEHKTLRFATNMCMFTEDFEPLGLYAEYGFMLKDVKNCNGKANFCIKPSCIFYIGYDNKAKMCKANEFNYDLRKTKYAVQLAPMVVVNGKINPVMNSYKGSKVIRSGVGILADGKVVFVLSKDPVSFYELAEYFHGIGCVNASYIDGNVSTMYYPKEHLGFSDEAFAVIFAVTTKNK